jgi:glutamine amidotransferase
MSIVIIKYNAGNVFSVESAVKRLGGDVLVTDDREQLRKADRVIFPGQGEAGTAMRYLREHGLDGIIRNLTQPVLGICIGMQLLCSHSEEGDTPCIGIFDSVNVQRFIPERHEDKVPHIGWNTLVNVKAPLFNPAQEGEYAYFVHSYYIPVNPYTIAETNYIHPFSSALHKDNFFATQFHPEKSGSVGESILRNFLLNC